MMTGSSRARRLLDYAGDERATERSRTLTARDEGVPERVTVRLAADDFVGNGARTLTSSGEPFAKRYSCW